MWSKLSVQSAYVRDEATYALNRNKLVPVKIEEVDLPFRFEGIQTVGLINWDGSDSFHGFQQLAGDIAKILNSPAVSTEEADRARKVEAERKPDGKDQTKISEAPKKSYATKIGVLTAIAVVIIAGAILLFRQEPQKEKEPTDKTPTRDVPVSDTKTTPPPAKPVPPTVDKHSDAINQIETKIVQGDYVDRKTIVVLGQDGLEQIVKMILKLQGVDKQSFQNLGTQTLPKNVSHQIEEVVAAQKEVAAKGVSTTPQAAYHLGMLAAYNRDYKTALEYFRQSSQTDPEYSDAFEAISWLQQSLAMDDLQSQNYTAAKERLDEARRAAERTDPLDPNALTQRGYIAKTLAQISEAMNDQPNKKKYYEEAARFFRHVVQLDPDNAGAQNGLGNIEHALGNIDAAITCYNRAIKLMPNYTAAYHDVAIAFETKMNTDPAHTKDWCKKALEAWQKTYELAPNDPGFSADYIVTIGKRISWLKHKCGKGS